MKECPKCHFVLEDNNEVMKVSKLLRIKKSNNDDSNYPILVADFICKKCNKTIHIKWSDAVENFELIKCPVCSNDLVVSLFLGAMNGFNLKSVCFSCYHELGSGNIAMKI
ncbi:MAG: hypothetical protein PHN56_01375 [Candidatus Nanoarchaeia archaeon]|nr:hypothetical protein [Candidatus Nanoarchaeia archaeon]